MHQKSHEYWLNLMNQSIYKEWDNDNYNQGPLVCELENRVADLLKKPQALFFNKGTTCQLAALKTACNLKDNNRVVLHPKSHIALDEQDAYQELMGLQGVLIGDQSAPFGINELLQVNEKVAVLTVELPLRRVGFKLTQWRELQKMRQWCDEHGVHFHLDGARLWESTYFYQKSLSQIAALFDSVYVSLYKGIGGMSGALLVGSHEFLSQCGAWRNRLGSNMYTSFPALITGLEGIDNNLSHIPSWVERALEIYKILQNINGVEVEKPHTNGFQIKIKGNKASINQRLKRLESQQQMVLCKPFDHTEFDQMLYSEIQPGAGHQTISNAEVAVFFHDLLRP